MAGSRRGGAPSTLRVVTLLLLPGCAGADLDLNPLYVGRVNEAPGGRDARAHVLGPLWDHSERPGREEAALHPLWRKVVTPESTRVQVLAPLFASRWTNDEDSHRFLALAVSRSHRSLSTESDRDFMLFPLLWFGSGPGDDDRYFALFPLFGTIQRFAAFAEVGFVLFPLYYWARKDVTAPETLHSVTPLIGWTSGGPRERSWRVLPLAGRWSWEGRHDKWTFLWPILHFQRNRLDTGDPSTVVTVWPLFGIERSERLRFLSFLWPFFRFRSERVARVGGADGPREEVHFRHDFLWPLYRREHTRERDYLRLFPFYARQRSEEVDYDAFAIPLLWRIERRDREWTKRSFHLVPFVHRSRRSWKAADGAAGRPDDTAFKLWPLFATASEAGAEETKIPALLPLDIERFTGDFEASWGPLFELWRSRREADGSTRGNALLRLVDWESRGGRRRFSIPLLYSGDWGPRRSTHSLLLGILRFGGGEGGAELKLLGMPILTPEVRPR